MEHSRDFDQHFKKYIKKLDLFRIDAEKFENELNSKIISPELKNAFKNEGFSLPDNAPITKIKNKKWEITTVLENNQKTLKEYAHKVTSSVTFIVRKKYGKLNIYNEFGEEKINEL